MSNDENKFQPIFQILHIKSAWFLLKLAMALVTTIGMRFLQVCMIPQVDLFSFIFWRKLKAPKRHLKIIWHLVGSKTVWNLKIWKGLGSKVLLWSPLRRLLVRRGTTHERVFWNKRGRGRRALFIRKPAGTYCWLDSIKNPSFRSCIITEQCVNVETLKPNCQINQLTNEIE